MLFAVIAYDEPVRKKSIKIDETLFDRIAKGEKEAFCRLYEQTKGAVYAYALSILCHQADAEDVMQETYLRIRSAAHLYQPQGKPLVWIFTITRNLCLMRLRNRKRNIHAELDDVQKGKICEELKSSENRMILDMAFQILSEEECQIILLHAVVGLKHREIAENLQLSLSTVLSRYNRGIKKMRKLLEGRL